MRSSKDFSSFYLPEENFTFEITLENDVPKVNAVDE